ncbi:MAG TPA: hypothetical protein VFU47_04820, partial [Armatimonadota bacterium]|nr:hypothetical protein [Armatimonadota bacterium]
MEGSVFLLDEGGGLRALKGEPYASEDFLQELIERYPQLLAGEQMDPEEPRRWLLVSREFGVPGEQDGSNRWSLDHLFLDQDGIPTLVEVKRSSDTRIRREVVGQMLDYAANGLVYWPPEGIRQQYEFRVQAAGADPEQELLAEFRWDRGYEEYWQTVKRNLQAGKVRLVFVADVIPNELKRIVEFLNEQMNQAEVLAIEVKQYSGPGVRTLVPRVLGITAGAERAKGTPRSDRPWDQGRFFGEIEQKHGPTAAAAARSLYEWAKPQSSRIYWGKGAQSG